MYGGGSALDLLDDDDVEPQAISPVASPPKEEVVDIVVKMELDPVKKANAPAAAIRMYERPITLKLRRVSHLYSQNITNNGLTFGTFFRDGQGEIMFRALEVMGDKLQRAPDDIILIYEGKRVYSRDTARQLGILGGSSVEMSLFIFFLSTCIVVANFCTNDIYQRVTKSLTGTDLKPNDSGGSKTLTSTLIAHHPLNLLPMPKPKPKPMPMPMLKYLRLPIPNINPNLSVLPNYTPASHPLSSNLQILTPKIPSAPTTTAPLQGRKIRSSLWSGVRTVKRRG